jgi:hypothetical protein
MYPYNLNLPKLVAWLVTSPDFIAWATTFAVGVTATMLLGRAVWRVAGGRRVHLAA